MNDTLLMIKWEELVDHANYYNNSPSLCSLVES